MKHSNIFRQPILFVTLTSLIIVITFHNCEKDPDKNNNDPADNPADAIPSCWTKLGNMQIARATHFTVANNNKVYVAGNRTGGNSLETYDLETDNWSFLTSMSFGREFGAGCAINGKIYAVGGYKKPDTYRNNLEEYDPESDQWTTMSPMSAPRCGHSAVALDDKIYVMGGAMGWPVTEHYTSIEVYDPMMDTWKTIPDSTTSGFLYRWGFGACAVNGKIYVIGGIQADEYPPSGEFYPALADVQVYDPESNTWINRKPMPTARFGLAAVSVNNMIYAMGGMDGFGESQLYSVVEAYDPVNDTWVTKTPMPKELVNLAACAMDNKIYVSGGEDLNKSPYISVYAYTPESDSEAQ